MAGGAASDLNAEIDHIRFEALQGRIGQYESELRLLRTSKHNADLEIVELQMLLRTTQEKLQSLRHTVTFRLGKIFVDGFSSWRGGLRLVPKLATFLWVHVFSAAAQAGTKDSTLRQKAASRQVKAVADALVELKKNGPEAAASWARGANFDPSLLARVLLEIARAIRRTNMKLTIVLGKEAIALAPSEQRIKWLAFALADSGAVQEPADLLRGIIEAGSRLNANEMKRADELFALTRIVRDGFNLPQKRQIPLEGHSRSALLVGKRSLPYHWTASTMRLHANAHALVEAGWQAEVVTLPGYPERHSDDAPVKPATSVVFGVNYHRLPARSDAQMLDVYINEAAELIALRAVEIRASIIHVTGDLVSAYAGSFAARLANIPVLIDYSDRAADLPSFDPELRQAERHILFASWQKLLLRDADAVLGRTGSLADVLEAEGVAKQSIARVADIALTFQDGRDRSALVPPTPLLEGRLVLGYLGEASEDLDLEILPELLAEVTKSGIDAALLLVGIGRRIEAIQAKAAELGLADRVVVLPRPKLNAIHLHYGLMDIVVLPYRSQGWRAPYELVEAMAHGSCVITTDQFDARSILGEYGVFAARNTFAESLIELCRDEDRRQALGRAAAARARESFGAKRFGHELVQLYEQTRHRLAGADPKVRVLRPRAGHVQ